MNKNDLLALLVAGGLFLLLALVLNINFFLSAVIAMFSFGIIHFWTKPDPKFMDHDQLDLEIAQDLERLYVTSKTKLQHIEETSLRIDHPSIQNRAFELVEIGETIMDLLEDQPHLISDSRYFLSYYLDKTERILTSYYQIESGRVSSSKLNHIQEQSYETLSYLKQIFQMQNDAYHSKTAKDLTLENELLEATLAPEVIEQTLQENEKEAQKIHEE